MEEQKEKLIIRIFLILFIVSIFLWLIPSNIGFMKLTEPRAGELPQYVKNMSPLTRLIFLNLTFQLTYWIIALGLFIEFLSPKISLKWNKSKFLVFISIILIINGLLAFYFGGIREGFKNGLYDTMFFGVGFGILFLLILNNSIGMKIVLWTRLIEVFGPIIGYTVIPAFFGIYTAGAFGHYGHGFLTMISSRFFWNDFLVQSLSIIPVYIFLRKFKFRWFWIVSFSIGAIIVGLFLSYILPVVLR